MSRLVRSSFLAVVVVLGACREDPAGPVRLTILECETGSSYTIGRTVGGRLDADDCFAPGGEAFADYYRFTLRQAGPVAISVSTLASSGPLVIAILDAEQELVDLDQFPAGATGIVGGELDAGDYYIIIAAEDVGQVGAYSLSSTNSLPPTFPCDVFVPIAIPATVTGSIDATDCLDPIALANADYYDFTLPAPGPVSFRVTPASTGTMVVALSTSRGFFLEVLETTRDIPVTLGGMLQEGRFVLIVAGSAAGQTGGYTIVSSATIPPIEGVPPYLGCNTPQAYTIGTTVSGSLSTTDCRDGIGTPLDRYDFTLDVGRTITIDMRSVSFDPFLAVFNSEGGVIAYDDDSGEGVNSRITITLPAGAYAIGATGYYASSLGDYTLATSVSAASAAVATADAAAECAPVAGTGSSLPSLHELASACDRLGGSAWRLDRSGSGKAARRLR